MSGQPVDATRQVWNDADHQDALFAVVFRRCPWIIGWCAADLKHVFLLAVGCADDLHPDRDLAGLVACQIIERPDLLVADELVSGCWRAADKVDARGQRIGQEHVRCDTGAVVGVGDHIVDDGIRQRAARPCRADRQIGLDRRHCSFRDVVLQPVGCLRAAVVVLAYRGDVHQLGVGRRVRGERRRQHDRAADGAADRRPSGL